MMTLDDYRALFHASPYPYLVMAPDLTIIGASGAYLRSVKRTEEEIVGGEVFVAFA
jgi:PAS domain-containing protein